MVVAESTGKLVVSLSYVDVGQVVLVKFEKLRMSDLVQIFAQVSNNAELEFLKSQEILVIEKAELYLSTGAIVNNKERNPIKQDLLTGLVMFEIGFPSFVPNP